MLQKKGTATLISTFKKKKYSLSLTLVMTGVARWLMLYRVCSQQHTGRVFRLQFDEFQIVSSSHDDTILVFDFLNIPVPESQSQNSPSRGYPSYVTNWWNTTEMIQRQCDSNGLQQQQQFVLSSSRMSSWCWIDKPLRWLYPCVTTELYLSTWGFHLLTSVEPVSV